MKKRTVILAGIVSAMLLTATGCKNSSDVTTISWYVPGIIDGSDKEEVMNKVNEILQSKYGLKLDLIGVDNGNYEQKMQIMNASGDEYDLAFTSNWTNNYYTNINGGSLYDITELLPEYAPKLYASMDDVVWGAVEYDKKIYAVPNWQVQVRATSLDIPEEKLKKTGMKMEDINSFEDIETYLEKLVAQEPDSNKIAKMFDSLLPYYKMSAINNIACIRLQDDGKPTVINKYETPEYREHVNMRYSWVQKGLSTANYSPDGDAAQKGVEKCPLRVHVYKPGLAEELSSRYGYEWKSKQLSEAVMGTDGIAAAMTGVSANSAHPEEAVKLLEAINSDKELYNLIVWGIEGKHYNKLSENKIETVKDSAYSGVLNYEIGSLKNSFLYGTQSDNLWEETEKFNNDAVKTPILGFAVDNSKFKTEYANCTNVISEQCEFLELGLTNPDTGLDKFINDLKTAGSDKIIEECQKQIDEWWNENK